MEKRLDALYEFDPENTADYLKSTGVLTLKQDGIFKNKAFVLDGTLDIELQKEGSVILEITKDSEPIKVDHLTGMYKATDKLVLNMRPRFTEQGKLIFMNKHNFDLVILGYEGETLLVFFKKS